MLGIQLAANLDQRWASLTEGLAHMAIQNRAMFMSIGNTIESKPFAEMSDDEQLVVRSLAQAALSEALLRLESRLEDGPCS